MYCVCVYVCVCVCVCVDVCVDVYESVVFDLNSFTNSLEWNVQYLS